MVMQNPKKLQRAVGAIFLIAVTLLIIGPFIFKSGKNGTISIDETAEADQIREPVSVLSSSGGSDQSQYWSYGEEPMGELPPVGTILDPPKKEQKREEAKVTPPPLNLIADTEQQALAAKPKESPTSQKKQSPQATAEQFQWFVQVGGYGNINNAQAQYRQYQSAGYAVYIETEDGLHKVRLGPYRSREQADRVRATLKSQGIETTIVAPK